MIKIVKYKFLCSSISNIDRFQIISISVKPDTYITFREEM